MQEGEAGDRLAFPARGCDEANLVVEKAGRPVLVIDLAPSRTPEQDDGKAGVADQLEVRCCDDPLGDAPTELIPAVADPPGDPAVSELTAKFPAVTGVRNRASKLFTLYCGVWTVTK